MMDTQKDQQINNILVHLYNSEVIGLLGRIATLLRMKLPNVAMNHRYNDLKHFHSVL